MKIIAKHDMSFRYDTSIEILISAGAVLFPASFEMTDRLVVCNRSGDIFFIRNSQMFNFEVIHDES